MLPVLGVASAAFGVSILSALLPVISVEVFVLGLVVKGPHLPWWILAVIITLGQIGGKLLHYYAARGAINLPGLLRRGESREPGRWHNWLTRFKESCHRRPWRTNGVLLVSATTSLPPYAAIAVIAGWARIPLYAFIATGLLGRFVRFGALILVPGVVSTWL